MTCCPVNTNSWEVSIVQEMFKEWKPYIRIVFQVQRPHGGTSLSSKSEFNFLNSLLIYSTNINWALTKCLMQLDGDVCRGENENLISRSLLHWGNRYRNKYLENYPNRRVYKEWGLSIHLESDFMNEIDDWWMKQMIDEWNRWLS